MKNTLTATMPNATGVLLISLKTFPAPDPASFNKVLVEELNRS